MRKFLTLVTAGVIALLSLNSCEMMTSDFDATSCDASLTCFYAGGLPSDSAIETYGLDGPLRDRDIEEIFYELSEDVDPGFIEAVLEINFYDWMDNYTHTAVYYFWWVTTDVISGDGYYAWDERLE